jgi:hypothetical protein
MNMSASDLDASGEANSSFSKGANTERNGR